MLSVYAQQLKDWKDISQGGCMVDNVPTLKCFEVVFNNLLITSGMLVIVFLFLMLIAGGFNYLTAFGDPQKIKKAQGTIKYAVIGFILYISAFLILKIIDVIFLGNQGNIFKFEIPS